MGARWVRTALSLVIAAAVAGTASQVASALSEKTITIRLSWKAKGEFAPLFMAVQRGLYERAGVKVQVLEGTGAGPTLTVLANGNEQFAYVGAIETAQGIGQGMPLVMVANYIHRSPMVLVSFAPLRTPKDLEGKSLATSPQDTFRRIWEAFARTNGVDTGKVRLVNLDPSAGLTQFLQGRVDVLSAFYTNDVPIMYARSARHLNVLWVADYGFNVLGHGLVTTRKFADRNPRIVRAVVAGTGAGFDYTLHHAAEAADLMVRLFPEALSPDTTPLQVSSMLELVRSKATAGHPVGWNSDEEWRKTIAVLTRGGLVRGVESASTYYTNQFVGQ